MSLKLKGVILMALAKLSFGGGGATTLNVSVCDWPPPGGVFRTAMSLVLPNGPSKAAGRVALIQVGGWHVEVGAARVMPFGAPLKRTLTLLEKLVPVNWICTGVDGLVCTGVLFGLMLVSVGMAARTEKVIALLVCVPFTTVIFGVPAKLRREAGTVADIEVSEGVPAVVRAVVSKWMVPPVKPLPFTVSVNCGAPTLTEIGVMEEICGPEKLKLFKLMSQAPRPCVPARSVREGSWRRKE